MFVLHYYFYSILYVGSYIGITICKKNILHYYILIRFLRGYPICTTYLPTIYVLLQIVEWGVQLGVDAAPCIVVWEYIWWVWHRSPNSIYVGTTYTYTVQGILLGIHTYIILSNMKVLYNVKKYSSSSTLSIFHNKLGWNSIAALNLFTFNKNPLNSKTCTRDFLKNMSQPLILKIARQAGSARCVGIL